MTSPRDEELNKLEEELNTPFIEQPDTLDGADGAECFLDFTRRCGASCMAYVVEEVDEEGGLIQGSDKCTLLRNSNDLVRLAVMPNRQKVRAAQSTARKEQLETPPPNPYGSTK